MVETGDTLAPAAFRAFAGRLDWACPHCRSDLPPLEASGEQECKGCGATYPLRDGIWRMLPPARQDRYSKFIREYKAVREAEGRFGDGDYLRSLPFVDRGCPGAGSWMIRARSFSCLRDRVLPPREGQGPLRILDLGAGNGWLSHQLSRRGHFPTAVDIWAGPGDGLACVGYYETPLLAVQAEFDRLPWKDQQFEVAVFNASLHYSCGYETTLAEALRVIRPGGVLVIMDTPVYHDPQSGLQMVREREREFTRRFGFPSNALPMENFLTFQRLRQLEATLGVRWRFERPRYGWRWSLRPWKARLAGRREPARFRIILADKQGAS